MSIQKNFVVKNGFEASTNLIFADADTRRVGVGTTALQYTLHVNGGIGVTDLYVSGVGTFSTLNADDLFINSGVITSIVSTSGTITFLSGTSLNYSGISTLDILTSNQITSQDLEITGISTFNNVFLDGYLSVGGTTGQQNQVLVSTGVGVTWKPSSNLRTSTSFTATPGQTSFSATYSIGYVDVYINGVKLTNAEFVATNGNSIVLNDACFGGEAVEIISFEIEYPLTFSGITLQEEGSVVGTGINAINFVGTAVTAVSVGAGSTIFVNAQLPLTSSSNVVVGIITATLLDSTNGTITNLTGTAGTITTFNSTNGTITNLTGTDVSISGVTTSNSLSIGSTQVISSGRQLQNIVSLDATTTATIESAISNAPNDFNSLNISGISTLNNVIVGGATTALIVNGDARVTGILTVGTASITLDGNTNIINVGSGVTIDGSTGIIEASSIVIEGTTFTGAAVTSITAGSGISVDQSTGNVTISATGGGGGSSQWVSTAAGIHTLSNVGVGTTNPTSALTVKGNTSLETLNVSGVSTFGGQSTFNNGIILNGVSSNLSGSQRIILSGGEGLDTNLYNGGTAFSSFIFNSMQGGSTIEVGRLNGSGTLNLPLSQGGINVSGVSTFAGITTVTGTTLFTNQLSVSGVSTFGDQINFGSSALSYTQPDTFIFNNYSGGKIKLSAPAGVEVRSQGVGGDVIAYFANNPSQITYVELYYDNFKKFETIGAGVTVTGTTFTNQLSVSGVATATTFIGNLTGTATTATNAQGLTGTPNITVGIITATGGFVSIADTTPVTIQLVGNQLTFNAVGIGSTTLTLF
jgi:hypothetical protein